MGIYLFLIFLGIPSPYTMWKGGVSTRNLAILQRLHDKAQKKQLSTYEMKKIRKIEAFFNNTDNDSKKAAQLIWDLTTKYKSPYAKKT